MSLFDSLFGGGEKKAEGIYVQTLGSSRLAAHEEYFAVTGAIEFLSADNPMTAMESLFRQINDYTDRTGVHVGGLETGNFEMPFKSLLDAFQRSIRTGDFTKGHALGFLRRKQQELSRRI